MKIQSIGVVGTGRMGTGIARCAAQYGLHVTLVKWTGGSFEETRGAYIRSVEKDGALGHLTPEEAARAIHGIQWTLALHPLADCDLVIESIVEEEDAKLECFRKLDAVVRPDAILATNTSTLDVLDLARSTSRPERVVGLHFFNPVAVMKLVEVVVTDAASLAAVEAAAAFATRLRKEAITVANAPGFVVNRLMMAACLEAIRMAFDRERRVADLRSIDRCMRLGVRHPMGPFELMDLIGLDVIQAMAEALNEGLRSQHYATPYVLDDMVAHGWLGKKSGTGFYVYADGKPTGPNPDIEKLL